MAILSRFPIESIDHRKFENLREAERRGMIRVVVKAAGQLINFVQLTLIINMKMGAFSKRRSG